LLKMTFLQIRNIYRFNFLTSTDAVDSLLYDKLLGFEQYTQPDSTGVDHTSEAWRELGIE